jgi:hypothetical protein
MSDPDADIRKLTSCLAENPEGISQEFDNLGKNLQPSAESLKLLADACRARMYCWKGVLAELFTN